MEPVSALRKIAYLLEADRAPTYKPRAFRNAARSIEGVPPAELQRLSDRHQLTALDGVGPSSAEVITEALAGKVPRYLENLERTAAEPVAPDARGLCEQLQGDLHSHSNWSDGSVEIEEMADAAKALGHSYLALTDHSPRLTVAHGLDATRLRQQLDVVGHLNELLAPFRILTGIEVDILEDGSLDQDDDLLERLDVVVASVHSKLRMERRVMTARLLRAVQNPHTDILGHCTGRLLEGRGRPPSDFDAQAVFAACADSATAIEINSRPERQDPPDDLIDDALEAGCLFAIDTDAHAPGQLEWAQLGCARAAAAGVKAEQVVNTRSIVGIAQWTARIDGEP